VRSVRYGVTTTSLRESCSQMYLAQTNKQTNDQANGAQLAGEPPTEANLQHASRRREGGRGCDGVAGSLRRGRWVGLALCGRLCAVRVRPEIAPRDVHMRGPVGIEHPPRQPPHVRNLPHAHALHTHSQTHNARTHVPAHTHTRARAHACTSAPLHACVPSALPCDLRHNCATVFAAAPYHLVQPLVVRGRQPIHLPR
jgi:hypothetical protein